MFNSSLRRVARCPNASLSPLRPSPIPSHGLIVAAAFHTPSHQRRNSSSKPPIPPNNGSPPIPAASVKQVGAPRSNTDKRPGAESRLSKRGGKAAKSEKAETAKSTDEYSNEWTRSLPAVPSTQHLNPKDVYVASFFSTHRPISITGPLPPETSVQDIDKIFAIRPKSQRRAQDVIYTLSSAVQNLDQQVEQQQQQAEEGGVNPRADIIKALTQHNQGSATNPADSNAHHLDSQPQQQGTTQVRTIGNTNVKLVIQKLAQQFRPFNPPPAPVPAPEVEFFAPENEAEPVQAQAKPLVFEIVTEDAHQSLKQRRQKAAAKDKETDTSKTNNTFFTPSFQPTSSVRTRRGVLLVRDLPQIQAPSAERRAIRSPAVDRMKMFLISVKRQRRLKMKKHKYKKLQRKTRNLRRRQGKI